MQKQIKKVFKNNLRLQIFLNKNDGKQQLTFLKCFWNISSSAVSPLGALLNFLCRNLQQIVSYQKGFQLIFDQQQQHQQQQNNPPSKNPWRTPFLRVCVLIMRVVQMISVSKPRTWQTFTIDLNCLGTLYHLRKKKGSCIVKDS